jgi:hypothetical protein
MKTAHLCALVFACVLAVPSFGQQKTFNWVPGSDETVSLDPGFYHAGPSLQPSAKARDVHVDIDAQQPVTISMVPSQQWNDAVQAPENLKDLRYVCVQEHVRRAVYTCTPPPGLPVVIVVRDERVSEGEWLFGIGEVIARHDHAGQGTDRAISAGLGAELAGRPLREFISPNNVHLQYYDWSCTENCNLPDPPQPKMFNWVGAERETVRLDPANYYTSRTYHPGPQGGNMQVDIEAQYPVTIAMVDPAAWTDATEHPSAAKNLYNIDYLCVQQHAVKTTYACHLPGFWPQVLVVRDERNAGHDKHDGDDGQGKSTTGSSAVPRLIPMSVAGAALSDRNPPRPFASPNDVRIQYYSWRCIEGCDQPDFQWVQQVKEKYELTKILKVYGGLTPDHDGTQISIKVKSPVPMAVVILPSPTAGQLYGKPDMFESAVANSSCQQRGVQSSTFQCTFNVADGPQSLVLVPEAGVSVPNHRKAEVEVQAVKCIDNCTTLRPTR